MMIFLEKFGDFGESYVDLFNKDFLVGKEELLKDKQELVDILNDKNIKLSDFKRKILINKMNLMFLVLYYFEYLEKKYGMKVFRYIGKAMSLEMMDKSTKVKASNIKPLIDNYGHDGGYINYWKFKDVVVFKTIKSL